MNVLNIALGVIVIGLLIALTLWTVIHSRKHGWTSTRKVALSNLKKTGNAIGKGAKKGSEKIVPALRNAGRGIKAKWVQFRNWRHARRSNPPTESNLKKLWRLIRNIMPISNILMGGIAYLLFTYFPVGLYIYAGLIMGTMIVGMVGIFYKEELTHDPDKSEKLYLYIEVGQGRAAAITQGDKPIRIIQGGESPEFSFQAFGLWWLYQKIIHKATGLYPYIPFFTEPNAYNLPRYRVKEADGHKVYTVVEEGKPGYRSNHVRTEPTDWGFKYDGVDVQLIPFTAEGFAQYYIDKNLVEEAYYGTNSWNTLLDIALSSTIRSVLRSSATIDNILGAVPKKIWDPKIPADDFATTIVPAIMEGLKTFKVKDNKTLADFGIVVTRIDFTDFKDELDDKERAKLLAAVLGREAGRAADLTGQGVAKAQKDLLEAHGAGGGASDAVIQGEALVRAAATDGGLISVLLAALAKKQMEGK